MQTASNPAEQPFEQIVEQHQALVFRTLTRLTGRNANVDDLAQDVFLRLYRALPTFRGEAMLSTYLYRITVNVAQNEWKRLRREDRRHVDLDEGQSWETRLPDPGPSAIEQMQQAEFALLVDRHLNNLNQHEKTVLILYHQEERTYEQIAEVLGMPIGTVRTHLHRGRKKLREALKGATA